LTHPTPTAFERSTHRLLAQYVKLIERNENACLVEYPDGSRGTVTPSELVSMEAVLQEREAVRRAEREHEDAR
jgi:hypothetical protein